MRGVKRGEREKARMENELFGYMTKRQRRRRRRMAIVGLNKKQIFPTKFIYCVKLTRDLALSSNHRSVSIFGPPL